MSRSGINSLKIRAKLLQKLKKKSGHSIQLKDALQTVAKASGYNSWRELSINFEETEIFNPPRWSSQWKTWYASYDEALIHLKSVDGFLLPYRKQYFICDIHYIEALGISPSDPDLITIGRDWTKPIDLVAWNRVIDKIKKGQAPMTLLKT